MQPDDAASASPLYPAKRQPLAAIGRAPSSGTCWEIASGGAGHRAGLRLPTLAARRPKLAAVATRFEPVLQERPTNRGCAASDAALCRRLEPGPAWRPDPERCP